MHGIGLLSVTKTDSANFPSDFNLPIVIFLLDYQTRKQGAFSAHIPRQQVNAWAHNRRQ
jgi:hypothetical protein